MGTAGPTGTDLGRSLPRTDMGGVVTDSSITSFDSGPQSPCAPAVETCNGMDDDCDNAVDETFNVGGECMVTIAGCDALGTIACNPVNDTATVCNAPNDVGPQPEECNGLDDDCDGTADEGFPENCGNCVAMPEQCNGLDDDCDGTVDEEVVANGQGPQEACNGMDDDCDGQVDEGGACPCRTHVFENKTYLFCGGDVPGNPNAFDDRVPWTTAKTQCEQVGFNLVTIDSQPEDQFVYQKLAQESYGDSWMGLNDRQSEGQWVWSNNLPLGYSNWDAGEPNNGGGNEDCGIMLMSPGRAGTTALGDRSYHFVCEP